ncbi:amidase [Nocardia caishijiensis]|uniref:amidase n=1 Tax=Nocardia caishijiensis TaxID=184756 RepID=A0ABQ6YN70_9NOCA|nr:amidase [Nocardia caishijiensis]
MEAALARIEAGAALNAFCVVRREEVRAEAKALAHRADLRLLPLAGVPVGIKDHVDVAGCPTRHGTAALSGVPAAVDDELVRRLRAAGALVVGKTTLPELCQGPFTESVEFGVTRNPWNPEHTSGGSSGGSAAAVAAGMVPLALASGGGGSIRIPASCCGVVGLKPGPGLVPRAGRGWRGMSELGPIATTVADAALMLDVLSGTDRYRKAMAEPDRALRIGVTTAPPTPGVRVDPQVRVALDAAARALRDEGHVVDTVAPPWRLRDQPRYVARYFAGSADDADGLALRALERRTRAIVCAGRLLRRLPVARDEIPAETAARFSAWFSNYDVLMMPTLAALPPRAGGWASAGMIRTHLATSVLVPFLLPFNLVRYPALTVPAGLSIDRLPIGVQMAAAPGGEGLLLSLAAQFERLRPWPRHAP